MRTVLMVLCSAVALSASAGPARAAEPLDTIVVGPGSGAGAEVTGTFAVAAGTLYTAVVSGSLGQTFSNPQSMGTITYDPFYCSAGNPATFCSPRAQMSQNRVIFARTTGSQQGAYATDQTLADRVEPGRTAPPYEEDHEYSVTVSFLKAGKIQLSTQPQCSVGQTSCSGPGFTLKLYAKEAPPASPPTPTPTPTPPAASADIDPAKVTVTVSEIVGEVAYRFNAGAWMELKPGATIPGNAEIFTGVESSLKLNFEDGASMKIDELTQLILDSVLRRENRKDIAIHLVVGKIKASVQKDKSLDTNFEIQTPTATASVRGTVFTVFYDPATRTTLVSTEKGAVEVDPVKAGLGTVLVPAGFEVEVTPKRISPLAAIGKVGARGGINRIRALALVGDRIARAAKRCRLTIPRSPNVSGVTPTPGGWAVSVRVAGRARGTTTWTVRGGRVKATNAVARRVARRCS